MNRDTRYPARRSQSDARQESFEFDQYFQAVLNEFETARRRSVEIPDRYYAVGGQILRLQFATSALLPFVTPALEHVRVEHRSSPALTVYLWDSASTDTRLPSLPRSAQHDIRRGGVFRYEDGCRHAVINGVTGMLNMLDTRRRLALFCMRDVRQYPSYQVSSPLLVLFHWGLRRFGLQFVHAASVGMPAEGGVLIVGKGGSGKSTTAVACLASDLSFVSDDYCLLGSSPVPSAFNIYNSAKVKEETIHRFPFLASLELEADHISADKRVLFLNRRYPKKLIGGFPLRAVLVPSVTGRRDTAVSRTSTAEGLKALAPSTIFQLSGAGREAFVSMSDIIREIPCYHLELGTDLAQVPTAILDLLSGGRHS